MQIESDRESLSRDLHVVGALVDELGSYAELLVL